jgi:hypothetical protein
MGAGMSAALLNRRWSCEGSIHFGGPRSLPPAQLRGDIQDEQPRSLAALEGRVA